ncbi:MAG TPA: valine--tRNA ligase [Steroidobacteraceae bacterium]|nr:valine--tRNA ligase [Steroidobacteraceae bacterium]
MEKSYSPSDIEERVYRHWEQSGLFAPAGDGKPYCIVIPPPNVTGTLHMGHAFQDTIMDALTRFHRMSGDRTLWQPGTDHAGIATQMVVERQLNAEGLNRRDLGREKFTARVWQWKEQSGGTIARQLRRLGASVDWGRDRFTMDPAMSAAVLEAFVRLHEQGLIYRGKRLVNWDPVLKTALSDLEVQSAEETGSLWHIRYPFADGAGHVTVATTRPETLLGDTAVAFHPDDGRYRGFEGRRLRLPLAERDIPMIADAFVDPAFGSGCVKLTPAHDFNDYEVGQRHGLPMINVLTADAKIGDGAPARYRGLDRFEARKRVVADLEAAGLLEKVEPHRLTVPRGDRSGAVLEPWLTDQWYVKIAPLAERAIRAVEDGGIRFVPANWDKTYFEWMRNIRDWCISRQLWWGHRIPAWYGPDGAPYVGRSEAEVRSKHGIAAGTPLVQDEDVLDTWFSSALWPFSTMGWPADTAELRAFYPTSVLVTGFDIIFFWVARMIMFGLHFTGQVPFREVYVHGLIRDHEGQKMSKSKGNVIDPLDIVDGIGLEELVAKRTTGLMQPQLAPAIERATRKQFPQGIPAYGTDALRFTFAALATQSRDLRFDLGRVEGYRNFCNKLWNAARFVLMSTEQDEGPGPERLSQYDRWICSRLQAAIAGVRRGFADYRFDLAAQAAYEFTWYEFCDWYLEFTKTVLQSQDSTPEERRGTRRTLIETLETLLRLLHPVMPFITEELWQAVAPRAGKATASIMREPYPSADAALIDEEAEALTSLARDVTLGIRGIRGSFDIAPSVRTPIHIENASAEDRLHIESSASAIFRLAGVSKITWLEAGEEAPKSAAVSVGKLVVHLPLAGLIDDVAAELARLDKRRSKIGQELARAEAKLGNENFVRNAPAEVVAQEQARVLEFKRELAQLAEQYERVASLR